MAKQPVKMSHAVPEQRAGEGYPVSVQITDGENGRKVLQADLNQVPAPSKQYVAELASVAYEKETVLLYFAQEMLGGAGLRNLLVVHMAPLSAVRFLNVVEDIRKPSIQEVADKIGIQPAQLTEINVEPKDTVALSVTAGMAGLSGRDGCIDFFSASPFSIGLAQRAQKLSLDPVVRVYLRASLLVALVSKMRTIVDEIPEVLKSDEFE
jgi:hypothetical protein